MIKLYKSAVHRNQWIAHVEGLGWVMFPVRENGWEMRQAARGLDPLYLREMPLRCAAEAGLPQDVCELELAEVA
ncbi:MAG TPA: hypothetical protein VMU19_02670 [Bryobacteraceae bacterium]|nr:hypothetical protein [Bryobacteraceae bacterium]